MNSYSVTGCIVTHNNMRTIKETLDTLLQNTKGVNFKLYVVDNLSTDGTPDFIKANYSDVEIVLPGDNKGFGAGHNKILSLLNSKYHAIINPDISIEDDVIHKLAEFMDENEDVGLASPRICFPEGKEQILGKRNPSIKYLVASRFRKKDKPGHLLREYAMLDADLTRPFDIENATGCFMFIRTDLFKKLGGFDEKYFMYFEDADLTRVVRKTKRAVFFPDAVVLHVWGRESKKNMKLMLVQIKSMFHYFSKWK
ncbi:MAG: glycosyltransferase family 2 protein [Eubacteriales bacterium]